MENDGSSFRHNLKPHAFGMIGLLILEYLLGIATTLFVKFPDNKHGNQLWEFARTQMPLILHIIFGLLLLLGTIAITIRAFRLKNKAWMIPSAVALLAVIGAIAGGAIFVPSQTDTYSFFMAVSFIVALLAYFWGLYRDRS